ncbi:hypothetical protein CANMA_001128 [Candida margitis]|uniref:uncharacterized protein n=1 Tax=Candida margitis TaxID=1775924 RepID=UPI0022268743|nr:uncharacterized protein CANMA_001128 [Candida margitis]KAI5969838.1 hypothetical protein CANMA_001128 [Candida margitis]
MSDSEDDEIFESLMATRVRRSNAGSRLKQLIELEGEANEVEKSPSQFTTEDDENVNLLFQDDEDDQEFVDEDMEEESLLDEQDEDEEGSGKTGDMIPPDSGDERDEAGEETQEVNSDDVLSDSDLSASESDESEGEKELQKQERIRKRRKKTVIPQIKKVSEKPVVKRSKRSPLVTSDSLLMSSRRSSSRASAVESKQALIDRLKESEERKAKYVPVERKYVKELTQAERLAQAAETEKENIESLNRFKEQEIVKKERQRQSLLSKRTKLQNVLRWVSKGIYVTPNEEVAEARRQFELYMKKRKRLGKKKKGNEDEVAVIRAPFSIDYSSPYQRALADAKKRAQEEEEDRLESINCLLMKKVIEHESKGDTLTTSEVEIIDQKEEDGNTSDSKQTDQIKVKTEPSEEGENSGDGVTLVETRVDDKFKEDLTLEEHLKAPEPHGTVEDSTEASKGTSDANNEDKSETKDEGIVANGEEQNDDLKKGNEEAPTEPPAGSESFINLANKEALSITESHSPKRVKFADELNDKESRPSPIKQESTEDTPNNEVSEISSVEGTPIPDDHLPNDTTDDQTYKEIFEGPIQKVSRNTIYLADFDEDKRQFRLTASNVKQILFGEQSLWSAARRSNEVKNLLRIGKQENPYATKKDNRENDLFTPISELNEDDPMFDELKKLPRLGIQQDIVEVAENDEENDSAEIVIQTEAPTGLYLPNGNKKVCMVSGTEVKYFDPSTGMPYSSVDVYRTLKLIESGQAEWLGLDATDNGPVDLYLGFKGENAKHAKGVPEGF